MTTDRELARHQSMIATYVLQRLGQAVLAATVVSIACVVGAALFDENGLWVAMIAAPVAFAFVLLQSRVPEPRIPLSTMSEEDERRLSGEGS